MTYSDRPATPADAFAHYGIKGMKWGVRKEEPTSTEAPSGNKSSRAKKIAIGVGVLAVVAGAGYASYALNKNGSLSLGDMRSRTSSRAAPATRKVLKEPTSVIHLARGKNRGLTFQKKGDTPDFFKVFDKMGMNTNQEHEFLQKASDGSGRIAARFIDPEGRRDRSSRPISHDVVIPRSMSDGINSLDDVKSKIWPHLKDTYDQFYQDSLTPNFRGG